MSGNPKYTSAHFNEHGYCSTSRNRSLETSRRTVGPDNHTHAANFYMEQRAPTFAPSRENGHLGYYSASGMTGHIQARKRSRSASASKKIPSDSLAPESHGISQRLQNRATPLSSSCCNLPSASSQQTKSGKSSDEKAGSKRSNFSKGQTDVLKGWLGAHLEHPYPTEDEKLALSKAAKISLNQVNTYYTNVRRRPCYFKMCEEQGIVPVQRKKKAKISTSEEGDKENQDPARGGLDSGIASDGSRRTSANSSNNSPPMETSSPEAVEASSPEIVEASSPEVVEACQEQVFAVDAGASDSCPASDSSLRAAANSSNDLPQLETSSPEIVVEASQEHVFVVDAAIDPPQSGVLVFDQGPGFIPAPPMPEVSPEVLAVSRQVTDHQFYVDVHPQRGALEFLLFAASVHHEADVKAYEMNMPRKQYIAERLLAEAPGATKHQGTGPVVY